MGETNRKFLAEAMRHYLAAIVSQAVDAVRSHGFRVDVSWREDEEVGTVEVSEPAGVDRKDHIEAPQETGTGCESPTNPLPPKPVRLKFMREKKPAKSPAAKICSEPGCGSPKIAKGLCSKHYYQQRGKVKPVAQNRTGIDDGPENSVIGAKPVAVSKKCSTDICNQPRKAGFKYCEKCIAAQSKDE